MELYHSNGLQRASDHAQQSLKTWETKGPLLAVSMYFLLCRNI